MNNEMKEFDREKWNLKSRKTVFSSLIVSVFLAFIVGWLFLIPALFVVFLIYGLSVYLKDRKHRITVTSKPTEEMKAIARKEAEIKREKDLLSAANRPQ